jgi:uncharacterized phage infection (PIP) family protein YhgE
LHVHDACKGVVISQDVLGDASWNMDGSHLPHICFYLTITDMVEVDILAQLSTIMTIVLVLGGAIFGGIRWLNQQGDKKVAKAKEEADKTANELKELTEHVAIQIKTEAEETARDVKDLTERIAKEMKTSSDLVNKELVSKIEQVDKRVTEMLGDLRKRADLTNGNVATIRTEIQDLNDDLQELYDRVPESPLIAAEDGNGAALQARLKRTKEREKKQRLKRRKIEADRVEQSERYLSAAKT